MAKHKSVMVATNVKVYFCDPQSPWQRGTNENTNGPYIFHRGRVKEIFIIVGHFVLAACC